MKRLVFGSAHPNRGFAQGRKRVQSADRFDLAELLLGDERTDEHLGRRRAFERPGIDSQHGSRGARELAKSLARPKRATVLHRREEQAAIAIETTTATLSERDTGRG